jgi:hypothetical protein
MGVGCLKIDDETDNSAGSVVTNNSFCHISYII